jgi:protein-tyrosine kinase
VRNPPPRLQPVLPAGLLPAEPPADAQRRIGAILVDQGALGIDAAERVLEVQRERGGRFGDIAVSLGFVSPQQVLRALARQRGTPQLFPDDRARLAPAIRAALDDAALMRAYTDARTQLELRWFGDDPEHRAMAVIGCAPGEGRTFTTCLLGLLLAMTGRRVLLIDACVAAPGTRAMLGGQPAALGLDEAISRPETAFALPSALDSVDIAVLEARHGTLGEDVIASRAFASMLEALTTAWDAILVDTPAASMDRRALSAAVRCGGALFVTRLGASPLAHLEGLRKALVDAGVELVGALTRRP